MEKMTVDQFRKELKKRPGGSRANDLTKAIVQWIRLNVGTAWRQNNIGVYDEKIGKYRKSPGTLKGVSDIIGIAEDGTFIAIEVKAGKDRLSEDQKDFLKLVRMMNGHAIEARSLDDVINYFQSLKL